MVSETLAAWGQVDILVNNAAVFANIDLKPFTEISASEWDHVMAVNARGPVLCAQAVTPGMRERGQGKIINIAPGFTQSDFITGQTILVDGGALTH